MFNGSSNFRSFRQFGRQFSRFTGGISGTFLMGPGIFLVLLGIAILLWPELFALIVSGLLFLGGGTLLVWGWRLNQTEKRIFRQMRQQDSQTVVYDVETGYQRSANDSDEIYLPRR